MSTLMEPCQLRPLTLQDEDSFYRSVKEWGAAPGFNFAPEFKKGMSYPEYLDLLKDHEMGQRLPSGIVPHTVLYGFVGPEIVGRVGLRHVLNDYLSRVGGHIGYGVLPRFRQMGMATSLLKQTLPWAKKRGLVRVLLTCDENNVPSFKVIEKCGGVLESIVDLEEGRKRRYWIELQ